jgi:Ca-activated chloride channel family protein
MKPCPVEERVTRLTLGDLPAHEADLLRKHLDSCASCRALQERIDPVVANLRAALEREAALPVPRLSDDRRARVLGTRPRSRVIHWIAAPRPWLRAAAVLVLCGGVATALFMTAVSGNRHRAINTLAYDGVAEAPACLAAPAAMPAAEAPPPPSASPAPASTAAPVPAPAQPSSTVPQRQPQPRSGAAVENLGVVAHAPFANAPAGSGPATRTDSSAALAPAEPDRTTDGFVGGDLGGKAEPVVFKGLYAGRTSGGRINALHAGVAEGKEKERKKANLSDGQTDMPTADGKLAGGGSGGGGDAGGQPAAAFSGAAPVSGRPAATTRSLNRGNAAIERGSVAGQAYFFDADANGVADDRKSRSELRRAPAASAPTGGDKDGDGQRKRWQTEMRLGETVDRLEAAAYEVAAPAQNLERAKDLSYKRDLAEANRPVAEKQAAAKDQAAAERVAPDLPPPPRERTPAAHNPFVETAAQPFSTFAIDVDTASYTLTRQAIDAGQLPDPEVVRTEEIVNFFDYGDAAPLRSTFRIYLEGAPSPFGPNLTLLRIGIKGRRLGREEQRPAMLTFLVDTSGSMAQSDRIGLARQALALLLDQLGERDTLQLVAYDDRARVVLEATPAREKAAILAAFDRLQCTGSTNLEDGMRLAYQQAANVFVPGGENRVVLVSDGVANLGSDSADDILKEVQRYRRQGITCSVFGVGRGTYNDRMLEELANHGDGTYRFLDSAEEVRRAFVDDLAATLNTIASDVKIQVEWNPRVVRRYRQLGYENRALTAEQFRDDTVDAGEVGSGQSVTALYEADLASPAAAGENLGTVRVRYRRADNGRVEEIEQAIAASALAASADAARPEFRLAAAAAEFAEILRRSPYAAGGQFEDVARLLRPVALALPLDSRVRELLRLAEGAGSLSR